MNMIKVFFLLFFATLVTSKVFNKCDIGIIQRYEIEAMRSMNRYRAFYNGRRCFFTYPPYFASHSHSNECQYEKCKGHMSYNGGGPSTRTDKLGVYVGLWAEGVGGAGMSDGCSGTKGLSQEGHRFGILNPRYSGCVSGMNDPKSLVPINDDDESDEVEYRGAFVKKGDSFAPAFHAVRTADYDQRVKVSDLNEFRNIYGDEKVADNLVAEVSDAKYFEIRKTGFIQVTHSSLNCEG